MARNERRGTPGRLLTAWAYLLVLCVLFAWRVKFHRFTDPPENGYEVPLYPTALGDTRYYQPKDLADFFAPNIACPGVPQGLYRIKHQPVKRDDARMVKVDLYAGGPGPVLYRDAPNRVVKKDQPPKPTRYYLKAGENRYIEFSPVSIATSDNAPRAVPFVPPEAVPR
jgi:hypothetical protein